MHFCKSCLTTDLRPNAKFENGVCLACKFAAERVNRSDLLLSTLKNWLTDVRRARRKKSVFDCVVGVSGGKDSTRQALWVRDRLGMNPLLVCVAYPPKQISPIGARNMENLINLDFDLVTINPAPKTSCGLSRKSFETYGNVCTSTEIALFSGVPRLAIEYDIPLIFWGENPALQVGDSAAAGKDAFDGNNIRKMNTLQSPIDAWFEENEQDKKSNYIFPDAEKFEAADLQIIYLGAAWDDWGMELNSELGALSGLTLRPGEKSYTGDISEASMIDEEFTNINMMLKYYKYGFGRATDIVCEGIREGRLNRQDCIEIVKKYDGLCDDQIIEKYCKYIGITYQEFWQIAYRFVNWDLFKKPEIGFRPAPLFEPGEDYGN